MKKRWMAAALVCVLALTGGCGKSKSTDTAKTETETGIASLYPDSKLTKLGNYKGVEVAKADLEVSDDEIQTEIDNLLASNPT